MEDLYVAKISDIYGYSFDIGVFPAYLSKKSKGFPIKQLVPFFSFLVDKKIILAKNESTGFRKISYYEEILTGVRFSAVESRYRIKTLEEFPLLFLQEYKNLDRLDFDLSQENNDPYEYLPKEEMLSYFEIEEFLNYLNPSIKIYEELGIPKEKLINEKPLGKTLVRR